MTNQEAIKELETYAKNSWGELNEAFKLAIKALSEEKLTELERLAEIGKVAVELIAQKDSKIEHLNRHIEKITFQHKDSMTR